MSDAPGGRMMRNGREDPFRRETLARRGLGFVVVMVLAYVLLPLSAGTQDMPLVVAAAAVNLGLVAAVVFVPWRRLPEWAATVPVMAYLVVVALLRHAEGGAVSGYGVLTLLPVIWTALHMPRAALVAVLIAVPVTFLVPLLAIGGDAYPSSEWRRLLLTTALALLVGLHTHALVSRVRERADEFEAIMRSAGEGIVRLDCDGRVRVANAAAEEVLGRSAEHLRGRDLHELSHSRRPDGSPYPRATCPILAAAAGGEACSVDEEVFWRPDGTPVPVEYRAQPLLGADGGAVLTFRDITERRRIARMKDEFVSTVGHELRTPLTAIRGSLGLIEAGMLGPISEEARSMLAIGISNSDRLVRLINDILDIERIESGRVSMVRRLCGLEDLLARAEDLMAGPAEQAGVKLQVHRTPARLWADADRVLQVLTNLLSNAIKFSPPGGEVTVTPTVGDSEVVVAVSDQGRGIPADKLESVFERFSQVDASDAREKGGTGLGLAIARSIVHQHDGRIWIASEEGVGTTFFFALPLVRAIPGALPKALVLGTDATFREATVQMLRRSGYDAVEESRPSELANRLRADRPAVLLVDAAGLGSDGAAMLDQLRAVPEASAVPVITLAEHPGDERGRVLDEATLAAALRSHRGENLSALVVEDDHSLAMVLGQVLHRHGVEPTFAVTAQEAIERLDESRPDLIILDLVLPGGDGGEVVERLREQEESSPIPILVYTALDLDETARARLDVGSTQFLTKSRVSPDELERRLIAIVDRLTSEGAVR